MYIDSHCHLNDPRLAHDPEGLLKRAHDAGVEGMLTVCTSLAELPDQVVLSTRFPTVWHSVGVHPHEVKTEGTPSLEALEKACQHPRAVALGETGLDYHYENSDRPSQQESLLRHIEVSQTSGLPLILHCRDAEEDMLAILSQQRKLLGERPGVVHCFTGTPEFAEKSLAMGFYISISGIVTFKNSHSLQQIVRNLPLERLLIETDAPYLAPTPHRGRPNEPAFIKHTAEFVANLKGMTPEELGGVTRRNFFDLFPKAKAS